MSALPRVAVDGQVEFQAVWQKLDAALTSPVAVAEGPEHGGDVSAPGHGIRACSQGCQRQFDDVAGLAICGDAGRQLLDPVTAPSPPSSSGPR